LHQLEDSLAQKHMKEVQLRVAVSLKS